MTMLNNVNSTFSASCAITSTPSSQSTAICSYNYFGGTNPGAIEVPDPVTLTGALFQTLEVLAPASATASVTTTTSGSEVAQITGVKTTGTGASGSGSGTAAAAASTSSTSTSSGGRMGVGKVVMAGVFVVGCVLGMGL